MKKTLPLDLRGLRTSVHITDLDDQLADFYAEQRRKKEVAEASQRASRSKYLEGPVKHPVLQQKHRDERGRCRSGGRSRLRYEHNNGCSGDRICSDALAATTESPAPNQTL